MPEHIAAAALFMSLVFYALTAGADFGGGVWDLLARGERQAEQRKLIAQAIGPIWEANHVWLVLALVILFSAFPPALAAIATKLHFPITILMFGIVFRGAAFTFRHYSPPDRGTRWELVFAIASVVSPVLLGVTLGAAISGRMGDWLEPFPIALGAWTLVLFSYLAASYLAVEAPEGPLRDDFARKAIAAGVLVLVLGAVVTLLARSGAPHVARHLSDRKWAWSFPSATALSAGLALWLLVKRRVFLARVLVATEVVLVLTGWACAQYPLLVVPHLTIQEAAAPRSVLVLLDVALAAGALVLFPCLGYLFKVFKGETAFSVLDKS
ncbi:MAG TPA: cytochrome d ubiquinol oxidase subunit II [Planctomycetota bacterium]|nr:cytochrome d ubiquinol oxidase subunit II [Planctomycetota bacterium]